VILLARVGNIVLRMIRMRMIRMMVMWIGVMVRFAIVMTLVEMEQYVSMEHAQV